MRFLLLLCALVSFAAAAVPRELATALENFRPDPPRGWSYTQTTAAEGKSTVERYDAAKPEFDRWSLVEKNGRAPTADDIKTYAEMRSRRSRGGTEPKLIDQLDLATLEIAADAAERVTYRFRLKPGETGDKTASHLRASLVLHKPTRTIESIELASAGEFSPTLGVTIAELKTTMVCRVPAGETPMLPARVVTRIRGRAFWVKSLDAELIVTFSDYEKAVKK